MVSDSHGTRMRRKVGKEVRKKGNRDQTLCSSRILFCDWRRNRTGHMTEFACRQDKGTTRVHIVSDLRRTKPKFLVDQIKKLGGNLTRFRNRYRFI